MGEEVLCTWHVFVGAWGAIAWLVANAVEMMRVAVADVQQADPRPSLPVYIWAEGARYEGEYKEDKKNGRGVQTWPSGARWVIFVGPRS